MKVFSSSEGGMTFEDFLDMMSVFSDNAPKPVKVEYAFRIYGNCVCVCVVEEMGCDNLELNSNLSLILFDAFLVICPLIIFGGC